MKLIEITEPGGPEVLKVSQGKIPEYGENEVLISVKAAGVNRPDIMQREGKYPMPEGYSCSRTGSLGDRICNREKRYRFFSRRSRVRSPMGGYAEFCAVPVSQVLPAPQNLSFTEAAASSGNILYSMGQSFFAGESETGRCCTDPWCRKWHRDNRPRTVRCHEY